MPREATSLLTAFNVTSDLNPVSPDEYARALVDGLAPEYARAVMHELAARGYCYPRGDG